MPFNPNVPQPTDYISASQAQILANFQALAPVVGGIFTSLGATPEQPQRNYHYLILKLQATNY